VSVGDVWIGRYAVTVGEFRRFVEASGHRTDAERNTHGAQGCFTREEGKGDHRGGRSWRNPGFHQDDSHPVVCVSWNDAQVYVQWLNAQTGHTYQLPTEAEWEYAARAGTTTARFWGNDPDAACQFANVHDETSKRVNTGITWEHHRCDDRYPQTAAVGSFAPNAWGLHDMLGNVREWTCSVYHANYVGAEQDCDAGGERRAVRGGSWFDWPDWVRSGYRNWSTPGSRDYYLGLRLARSP
jgi:formylglycine-generating enzyme required for sulfatase activity